MIEKIIFIKLKFKSILKFNFLIKFKLIVISSLNNNKKKKINNSNINIKIMFNRIKL